MAIQENSENQLPETVKALFGETKGQQHLHDYILYDLALGKKILNEQEHEKVLTHLASCLFCATEIVDMQSSIEKNEKVSDISEPDTLQAAGESSERNVLVETTQGEKYRMYFQPIPETQQEILTLEVADSSICEELEGMEVVVFSSKGKVILRGTITDGTVIRRIDSSLRNDQPFHIQAA